MKKLIAVFFFLMLVMLKVDASNLFNYIEEPVLMENLQQFSSTGLIFKRCTECEPISLRPDGSVSYMENGEPVSLERALQIYYSKQVARLSIFYFRDTKRYTVVSFGSVPEVRVDERIELNGQRKKQ